MGFRAHFSFVFPDMQLVELIEKTVGGLGYELVDLEMSPRGRLLRVFIDKEAGISVDDCATVSHQLTRVFAVENIDYDRLEISSPGLDRPLKKAGDFERFAGEEAQIKLRIPLGNRRNFVGTLLGEAGGCVRFRVGEEELEISLDNIEKARLMPKL